MYKFVTGAASLLRHIHPQDGAGSAPPIDDRKMSPKTPGLLLMQAAVLVMGSLMMTSQASSQTYCHVGGDGSWPNDTNPAPPGIPSPYVVGIYTVGITNLSANCLTYYNNTNYAIKWSLENGGGKDIVSGLGVTYPYVNKVISAANSNAQAYHNETYKSGATGRSYFALYGRFGTTGGPADTDEWYIIDDWQGQLPSQTDSTLVPQGQITVKDNNNVIEGTYNVYERVITNSAGKHFQQWWSIRTSVRTNGWIHYINHFRAWQTLPTRKVTLPDDTIYNMNFSVEANHFSPASGEVDVSSIDLTSYRP